MKHNLICLLGAVVVMIIWQLDLQLPMHSVPINANVVSSNPAQAKCTRCNIMWSSLSVTNAGWWFSLGTPVSSTNKTDHHDITEILLKVTLNTINPICLFINELLLFLFQRWQISSIFLLKRKNQGMKTYPTSFTFIKMLIVMSTLQESQHYFSLQ